MDLAHQALHLGVLLKVGHDRTEDLLDALGAEGLLVLLDGEQEIVAVVLARLVLSLVEVLMVDHVLVPNRELIGVPVVTGTTSPLVTSVNDESPVLPLPVCVQTDVALMVPEPSNSQLASPRCV